MTDCSICCETFNKSKHSPIGCSNGACDIVACRTCVQTYILGEAPHEPACMGCKEVWSTEFLTANMTKTFVSKEIKAITSQRLFEQEQMRFPETQQRMVQDRTWKAYNVANRKMLSCQREIHKQVKRISETFGDEFMNVMQTITELKDTELDLISEERRLYTERDLTIPIGGGKNEKAAFLKACCRDECRGFLSRAWKCGVCELYSCSQCHEAKDEDHECDPDTVATVRLLKNDSKPCPKCACLITKIDGCDHMWCTNCNTGFSWRSGLELDNGRQTNPLYYAFMRRTQGSVPRTIGDNGGCQAEDSRLPEDWRFRGLYDWLLHQGRHSTISRIAMYIEVVRHVGIIEVRRNFFTADDNVPLRERYLMGKMTKKSFVQTITTRRNKEKVKETCLNTLRTFMHLSSERLNAMVRLSRLHVLNDGPYIDKLAEIDHIVKMTNETFDTIAQTYSRKYYMHIGMSEGPEVPHLLLSDNNGPRYASTAALTQT